MAVSDLSYVASEGSDGALAAVSIFADRPHVRAMMQDDAEALGFRVQQAGSIESLFAEATPRLGEIVLLDCPAIDGPGLASLAELDMQIAQQNGHFIVSTSVEALDAVFGCLDQSGAQILIDPSPAERSLALGRIMLRHPHLRVRELSEENRLMLLRLSEQVSQMAARLDKLLPSSTDGDERSAFRLESPRPAFAAQSGGGQQRTPRPRVACTNPGPAPGAADHPPASAPRQVFRSGTFR